MSDATKPVAKGDGCPICGGLLDRYSELLAGQTCEESEECAPCRYSREWAYGSTRVHVGYMEFVWSDRTPHDEAAAIEIDIDDAIVLAKAFREEASRG